MTIFKKSASDHLDHTSSLGHTNKLPKDVRACIKAYGDARQIGDLDEAHQYLVKALERIPTDEQYWRITAACLIDRGILEVEFGRYEDAEVTFQSSLGLYDANKGMEFEKNTCLSEMALAQLAQDETQLAESTFLKAKIYFESANDSCTKAVFFQNLGSLYQTTARPNEANTYTKQSLEIFSKESCDPKDHAGCLIQLGNLHRDSHTLPEAEKAYQDAIKLLKTAPVPQPELARCWLGLGNVYMDRQEFEQAIREIKKAIEYLEPKKCDSFDLALAKMNLGAAVMHLENYGEAIPHLESALRLYKNLQGESIYTTNCETNLGMAYVGNGDPIKGCYLLKKAVSEYERQPGTEIRLASSLMGLAVSYEQSGNTHDAVENARKVLAICEQKPFGTELLILNSKALLRRHNRSERQELSGEEFANRLNDDNDFRRRFRENPIRLAEQHDLTVGDVLDLVNRFNSEDLEDHTAMVTLLEMVVNMK